MVDKKSNTFLAVIYSTGLGGEIPARLSLLLQPLSGQPVFQHTIDSAREFAGNLPILIVDEQIELPTGDIDSGVLIIPMDEGENIIQALGKFKPSLWENAANLLLIPADMPLLTAATLKQLVAHHQATARSSNHSRTMTVASIRASGPQKLNGLILGENQRIIGVSMGKKPAADLVEEAEFDAGIYCLPSSLLQELLSNSARDARSLSWLVQSAFFADIPVHAFDINPQEALRIDSQTAYATAAGIMRTRINQDLMHSGVTIIDPATTYIDIQVLVGKDTVILPNTYLHGKTRIGQACRIGPGSLISDTIIGDRCVITFSVAEHAELEDDVDIGPFAHLRKGAHLAQGVHMGNYGEVKNSYLGPGTKMGHFSYVGDANIGPDVNIGAGVITANYDGENKHPTEIGAGAFIGSDTMLIAPVQIGAGARTGAGSVVTKDIPPNSLAVGIPARVIRKEEDKDGP